MLAPQTPPQAPAQTPNFAASQGANPQQASAPMAQQPAQGGAQGKNGKPVVHGLVSGQDIDERLSEASRGAQQQFLQAVASIPQLPDIFGVAIGPEAHDYITAVAQALQQQQQNSQQGASTAAPAQNAPAPAQGSTGGTPAMATSAAPTPASQAGAGQ